MSTDSHAVDLFRRVQCGLNDTAEALSRADIGALQASIKSLESLPRELLTSAADLDGSVAILIELRASCSVLLRSLARCGRIIHIFQAAETSINSQYQVPLRG